ncbi:hypothetical protein QOZ80_1BG0058610 [Eleusine coracana subsp. coracana]|nr:hypothetical protein QOZ80_1BG0058610 [Eleusine coracana subsp. coracana]
MAATTKTSLSMKLLVDGKAQRVLFAEASKEVVDFLFSLLALPVATAVKLVGKDAMVGSVSNLYASVEKLDSTYVQPGAAKDALLCPTVVSPAPSANSSILGLPAPTDDGQPKTFYRCTNTSYGNCRAYITDVHGTQCPTCRCTMTTAARNVSPANSGAGGSGTAVQQSTGGKGFVQGILTYTVLDNLTITPMSAISSITLLPFHQRLRGYTDSQGVTAVQDRPHRCVPRQAARGCCLKMQRVLFPEASKKLVREFKTAPADATTTITSLSMKLLIDGKAQRVLFTEASKEVVDFLFSLLALPVATTVKLVGSESMVGCVGNLYVSVEKLDATYVQAGAAKDDLLRPTVISSAATRNSSPAPPAGAAVVIRPAKDVLQVHAVKAAAPTSRT